ncbi:universal stress protein [Natronosalvus rutilus]|uniref:Universal stress protein n=1 Tax=Natronosalvus rutilus TaxID=2953753 RepID=A0A9E7NDL0_9EURY|nr:universal stress protein [Natronosalvus rutilus]UTF55561.1 universal stress protein [Natronosalvus rutilus]
MSGFIDSMLIPTDGSTGALVGANVGIALASQIGADVHVLSVAESRNGAVDSDDTVRSSLEERAEEAVEAVVTAVENHDEELDVTTVLEWGTPFQAIREYAVRHEIDVITMGTKGRTGLDRILLGSVTENVLRTARTPVLAVPPEAGVETPGEVTFERLLLPTDGSEGAAIATEWGIALATRLESIVHTVYSVDMSRFSGNQEPPDLISSLERRGEDALETVRNRARAADVGVSGSLATGPPAQVILTYASDRDIDLIVMGTHGQTGIGQWFLGSVTENVVRQADVPIFCVPVSAEAP